MKVCTAVPTLPLYLLDVKKKEVKFRLEQARKKRRCIIFKFKRQKEEQNGSDQID